MSIIERAADKLKRNVVVEQAIKNIPRDIIQDSKEKIQKDVSDIERITEKFKSAVAITAEIQRVEKQVVDNANWHAVVFSTLDN